MSEFSRRDFLRFGATGLAVAGSTSLLLRSDAAPTPDSGELGAYGDVTPAKPTGIAPIGSTPTPANPVLKVTESNILGPFHRSGAPFRGKVTPPLEPGKVLLISGRVWSYQTKKPLANAILDIWQANDAGRYDNDNRENPPSKNVFLNRARLATDENGFYEFETIMPGHYMNGDQFRPAHIHYWVRAEGHRELVTQLYFEKDPYNEIDPFIRRSLIIALKSVKATQGEYRSGTFDIVLAASARPIKP